MKPTTFDLISQPMACNKAEEDKFDCKLVGEKEEDNTYFGLMDNVVISGAIDGQLIVIGGDKADLLINGNVSCMIVDDNIVCNPGVR